MVTSVACQYNQRLDLPIHRQFPKSMTNHDDDDDEEAVSMRITGKLNSNKYLAKFAHFNLRAQ